MNNKYLKYISHKISQPNLNWSDVQEKYSRAYILEDFFAAFRCLNEGLVVVKRQILRLLQDLSTLLGQAIWLPTYTHHTLISDTINQLF